MIYLRQENANRYCWIQNMGSSAIVQIGSSGCSALSFVLSFEIFLQSSHEGRFLQSQSRKRRHTQSDCARNERTNQKNDTGKLLQGYDGSSGEVMIRFISFSAVLLSSSLAGRLIGTSDDNIRTWRRTHSTRPVSVRGGALSIPKRLELTHLYVRIRT